MSAQLLPMTCDPNQTLQVMVNIDNTNRSFILKLRWNKPAQYWVMTIIDAVTFVMVLDSIPLVTPGNLLEQYAHLAIGSLWLVNVDNTTTDRPDTTNLGTSWVLIWDDTP